ncbi:uncharacterized protein MELLADRAFT_63432 [Melampsora larici-populina 98AG31]|uniref:Uncharacterized protein n=1 Tax=Melampsora larici-populina (strain 98AG31 / pathotype 3-4-7) TaxID=747676 RepID=F4RML9_MELLP|nr:uncharacterized protein MELLADRAFT_63432 [Melampsora larici-populina 98AG31]EGG06358.1 hypothetical protein MELLADRAFT_63432 [Melampsora larici-populina 98AG31]
MRQTYLTFRVGEEEDMADIGVRNKAIEKRAERNTIKRGDDLYLDNPYAHGQVKQFIDPIDGESWEGRATAWDDPSRGESREEKSEVSKGTQSVRSALWAQTRSEPHTSQQTTPAIFNRQTHAPHASTSTFAATSNFTSSFQPPSQPANHNKPAINPNYKGNPANYIHNYRPNFKGGRGSGGDNGAGNGQSGSGFGQNGSGNGQGNWGRNRQGEENSNREGNGNGKGNAGRGYAHKK